jgi:hypothetical protein
MGDESDERGHDLGRGDSIGMTELEQDTIITAQRLAYRTGSNTKELFEVRIKSAIAELTASQVPEEKWDDALRSIKQEREWA